MTAPGFMVNIIGTFNAWNEFAIGMLFQEYLSEDVVRSQVPSRLWIGFSERSFAFHLVPDINDYRDTKENPQGIINRVDFLDSGFDLISASISFK